MQTGAANAAPRATISRVQRALTARKPSRRMPAPALEDDDHPFLTPQK
jgi:hypothetical protein